MEYNKVAPSSVSSATYIDFALKRNEEEISILEDGLAINNALKNIFSTRIGSVPGKPLYGSRLYSMIFEHMDFLTQSTIKQIINEEVLKFEPRVKIKQLDVTYIHEYNKTIIDMVYTFLRNGEKTLNNVTIPIII